MLCSPSLKFPAQAVLPMPSGGCCNGGAGFGLLASRYPLEQPANLDQGFPDLCQDRSVVSGEDSLRDDDGFLARPTLSGQSLLPELPENRDGFRGISSFPALALRGYSVGIEVRIP